VDEVYLDLTEEAQELLQHSSPETFSLEILAPVIESKAIISLGSQSEAAPEMRLRSDCDIEDGGSDGGEDNAEAEEEQHIRDICSQDHLLSSYATSPAPSVILSPQEWLARPGPAWFSDANESLERDRLLICASFLVTQIRKDIRDRLGFTCSAGIAHTKMLAKVLLPSLSIPPLTAVAVGGLRNEQTR
jgi:nucleotidyltransferase/DNA polymerase involved in DNA repair